MASSPLSTDTVETLADLMEQLGDVPHRRVCGGPIFGAATEHDLLDYQAKTGRVCELVDGVLVEKAMGWKESLLASLLIELLNRFVRLHNLGAVTPPDATIQLMPGLVRIPDVAFTSWSRIPGRRWPAQPIPNLVPDLAVEVLSSSNTVREMARKREEYFRVGVTLVWEADPVTRTVTVYTSPTESNTLTIADTLDGGVVLPGFTLPVSEWFGELDREG